MKPTLLLPLALAAVLASCGPSGPQTTAVPTDSGTDSLSSLATGSSITLQAGQTRQLNVTVNGAAAQPGQLRWTSSNTGIATVSQSGLVTAVQAGAATIRATLVSSPSAYIDFPLTVSAAATAPTTGTISATEQRVLDLTNQARATARTCGTTSYPAAGPLTWNASLAAAARGHAADMAAKNYFSHTSQDGRTFDVRIRNAGYTGYSTIGENIAAGQPTPEAVVAGWIASPGHCANIMNASFKELGVGVGSGGSYGIYWVQDFGAKF